LVRRIWFGQARIARHWNNPTSDLCHCRDTICITALIHFGKRGTVIIELIQYGPPLAGLALALGVWFVRRRSQVMPSRSSRTLTAIGMVTVLGVIVTIRAWGVWPWWSPPLGEDGHLVIQMLGFASPLILSVVALLLMIPGGRARSPRGSAELAPRTPLTFAPRSLVVLMGAVIALVLAVSISAGLASTPDLDGRYLVYAVEASTNTSASTTIYGWWFSLPCLALIALIIAIALVEIALIARPPLAADRDLDARMRKTRARNVVAVAAGGLLLHLGPVLLSLFGTSMLRLGVQTEPVGWIELGTSFAAIGPALAVASYVTVILGFALWCNVLLSTVPAWSRRPRGSVRR
jgi:hypothetical protein